jgi:hypothetical protein
MIIELNAIVGESQDELEQVTETTQPIVINTDDVQEFHPRRHGKVGTRIVYKNRAGCPVADLYETVKARMAEATGHAITDAPNLPERPVLTVVSNTEGEGEILN